MTADSVTADDLPVRVVVGDLVAYRRYVAAAASNEAEAPTATVVVAGADASTAEIVAVQLPLLQALHPARVVLHLGLADVLDGFDESYVHARVVEICDRLQQLAPGAQVCVVGIPRLPNGGSAEQSNVREQCNAAAAVTARLRGFSWADLVEPEG